MSDCHSSHSLRKNLTQWLSYLENLHSTEIDLGLERIQKVAKQLDIHFNSSTVITVAGTNGKGTTCAFIENALLGEKKKVAVYSSPHIELFNERLRINKVDIDDKSIILAFEHIEKTRGEVSLSYYEFTTLAAFLIIMEHKPDIIILEVGLGGRLDATNIIDCDIAVITTIDLDHQAFLGNDRESIGFEKAGIMRTNGLVVVGDPNPPKSLIEHAISLNARLCFRDKHFFISNQNEKWQWSFNNRIISDLQQTHIPVDNVATALSVLALLKVTLTSNKINKIIQQTRVAGRTEMFKTHCDVMLDVGHNPQAARYLANKIMNMSYNKVYAVTGMLADKDIANVLHPLENVIDSWYLGSLSVPRGASAQTISEKFLSSNKSFNCFDSVTEAFEIANKMANDGDLVLVFGSFYTVAQIRRLLI